MHKKHRYNTLTPSIQIIMIIFYSMLMELSTNKPLPPPPLLQGMPQLLPPARLADRPYLQEKGHTSYQYLVHRLNILETESEERERVVIVLQHENRRLTAQIHRHAKTIHRVAGALDYIFQEHLSDTELSSLSTTASEIVRIYSTLSNYNNESNQDGDPFYLENQI